MVKRRRRMTSCVSHCARSRCDVRGANTCDLLSTSTHRHSQVSPSCRLPVACPRSRDGLESLIELRVAPEEHHVLLTKALRNFKAYVPAMCVTIQTVRFGTTAKNQGQCGSCSAFSTTGALQDAWAQKSGSSLNEQQLVDCGSTCSGSNGGLMDCALAIAEQNAVCTKKSYCCTATDGACASSRYTWASAW